MITIKEAVTNTTAKFSHAISMRYIRKAIESENLVKLNS